MSKHKRIKDSINSSNKNKMPRNKPNKDPA